MKGGDANCLSVQVKSRPAAGTVERQKQTLTNLV
jgi:hypothetical protein|nr:MAG TPA: hypothetical protein [Caudoviricetes sp.]DAZ17896.1 MAG TPA: hypothetical protein [Caudoviricetes sp.]